jgi:hypothetical protein
MPRVALVGTVVASLLGLAVGYAIAPRVPVPHALLSSSEAGSRVREILRDEDPLRRLAELAGLLQRVDPEALPGIVEAYETVPLDGDLELVVLVTWWARFDPRAAFDWTSANWRAEYPRVLAAVFRVWAHSDPRKAWTVARRQRLPGLRDVCVEAAYVGWDESGLPGFVEFIRALEEPVDRQTAARVLARRRVLTLGAEGALRWVEALPEANDDFKAIVSARVATVAAESGEVEVAAVWAEPRITAGDERPSGLARRVATRWVRLDPEAAMAWLATLPPGKDRNDGVTEAFRDWLNLDFAAAIEWIEAREMEPWLEPAFGVYARAISRERPREAVEVAGRISDEALRNMITTVVARAWLTTDRPAAEAWLAEADLPEDVRERAYMVPRARPGRGRPRAAN